MEYVIKMIKYIFMFRFLLMGHENGTDENLRCHLMIGQYLTDTGEQFHHYSK